MDFLDALDAAVDGRCSCGCNAVITDASPSAWFATETCSIRWHGTVLGGPDLLAGFVEKVRAVFVGTIRALRGMLEQFAAAMRQFVAATNRAGEMLRERPAPPPRPTPRIDPGAGLSTAPLGRPAFRPARAY